MNRIQRSHYLLWLLSTLVYSLIETKRRTVLDCVSGKMDKCGDAIDCVDKREERERWMRKVIRRKEI